MNIGLVDVDGRVLRGTRWSNGRRYPNLALMKLSAWHKARGDSVEFARPGRSYGRIYVSKVFKDSPNPEIPPCGDVRRGGTGYGLYNELPRDVEHMKPDYSLYGVEDTAYGFLTRGCPRGCPFCIVSAKEGRASRKTADLSEWWSGQKKIKLLDPNILACPDWRDLLGQLAESRASVDFSQGLDIRLLTDEKAAAVNAVKVDNIHFAWDSPSDDLEPHFRRYAALAVRRPHGAYAAVYVLVNYDSTQEQDLHRIYTLRDLGYDPYVMVYDKSHAPARTRRLQRWCNSRPIFKSCRKFEDYHEGKWK